MKKFSVGLITGLLIGLILATTTFVLAANPIKLIVNGKEIKCDVPPQIIKGRTLIPAKFLAEALGAKVEWDSVKNAVVVTGGVQVNATSSKDLLTTKLISSKELHDKYGISITIINPSSNSMIRLTSATTTLELQSTEYEIIDDRIYFPESILERLGIE